MQDQKGKPATLSVLRHGQTIALPITPALMDAGDGTQSYRLGFAPIPPPVKVEQLSFGKAVKASWAFNKDKGLLIRDVIRGLSTTRQLASFSLDGDEQFYVEGSLRVCFRLASRG